MDSAAVAMEIPHHDAPVSLKKSRTAALEAMEDIVYGSVSCPLTNEALSEFR